MKRPGVVAAGGGAIAAMVEIVDEEMAVAIARKA
jgi:hypothetical protein